MNRDFYYNLHNKLYCEMEFYLTNELDNKIDDLFDKEVFELNGGLQREFEDQLDSELWVELNLKFNIV